MVLALGAAGTAQAQGVPRVPAEVLGGFTAGAVGGLFGAAGGQTLGELLPGSPTVWTLASTLVLHNSGTTWGSAVVSRLFEGQRPRYSEARKGAMIGDAALLVYAGIVSPILSSVGCGVGTWCGKTFGFAAHLLPAVGATIAIERAR